MSKNLKFQTLLAAIFFNSAYAAEPSDALYNNDLVKIPSIAVGNLVYDVEMVLDSAANLSSIGCYAMCFRLTKASISKIKQPLNFDFYDGKTAHIERLWFNNNLYSVKLELKGVLNNNFYFSPSHASQVKGPFAKDSLALEAPMDMINHVCSQSEYADPNAMLNYVIPVDLNTDDYKDFIVLYQCMVKYDLRGTEIRSETPALLVAYVSNSVGEYSIDNQTVFGEQYPTPGGTSFRYAEGDLNNDGITDYALAVSWEDGRAGGTNELDLTNAATPSIILSDGFGKYHVEKLGLPQWGYSVDVAKNTTGGLDVIFAGFVGEQLQAFRYVNGTFIDVRYDYPDNFHKPFWGAAFATLPSSGSTNQVVSQYANGTQQGIALWTKTGNEWKITSTFMLSASFYINYVSWQHTPKPNTPVFHLNGKQYVSGTFDSIKILKDFDNSGDFYIAATLATSQLDRKIDPAETILSGEAHPANPTYFFRVNNNELELVDIPVVNEQTKVNGWPEFRDVNGDGYTDMVTNAFSIDADWSDFNIGGSPLVYLNNTTGSFVKVGNEDWPVYNSWQSQGKLLDVNNDGYVDLLLMQMYLNGSRVRDTTGYPDWTNDIKIHTAEKAVAR